MLARRLKRLPKTLLLGPIQVRSQLPRSSPSQVPKDLLKAQQALPYEPILFPKLRIYFADFPYLHYSIDQRLITLGTWCGYWYGWVQDFFNPLVFQGSSRTHQTLQRCKALPIIKPYLRIIRFQGFRLLRRKENSSWGSCRRHQVHIRCRSKSVSQL